MAIDLNRKDCNCGKDHNSISWIVGAVLYNLEKKKVPYTSEIAARWVEEICHQVGWTRDGGQLEALQGFVADFDALQDLPVAEASQKTHPVRYDLIRDAVHNNEEEDEE